jgi:hypothetical protein
LLLPILNGNVCHKKLVYCNQGCADQELSENIEKTDGYEDQEVEEERF